MNDALKLANDLCRETLHGPPPIKSTMEVASALITTSAILEKAKTLLALLHNSYEPNDRLKQTVFQFLVEHGMKPKAESSSDGEG